MANPPIQIGEILDTPAPGSGVKSAWCQEITNRIVQRFGTSAARAAAYTAPGRGAPSYLASNNETEGVEYWNGTAWRKPWSLPWGQVAYASGQGQLVTAGGTELVLMTSPVFQAVAGRRYKITADFTGFGSVNLDTFRFTFRRGSTIAAPAVKIGPGNQFTTAYTPQVNVGYDFTAPAGPCQHSLCVARMVGTGVFTLVSAGTYENSLSVEDIGPVAGAVPS